MPERGFTTVGSRQIVDLGFLNVTIRDVEVPTGDVVERIVIEHPGAAAVVPLIEDDVILIEQYRAPVDTFLLELPAGKLDDGVRDPQVTAIRELEEETGFRAGRLTHLTDLLTTVGFSDEVISIYVASDLEPGVRTPIGAEEETATVVRIPLAEAIDGVFNGRIRDAKTVIGLLMAHHQRATHRGTS